MDLGTLLHTFSYNGTDGTDGSVQSWTVSGAVDGYVLVVMLGGNGSKQSNGSAAGNSGGLGGLVSVLVPVVDGQVLYAWVGGKPKNTGFLPSVLGTVNPGWGWADGGGGGETGLDFTATIMYGGGGGGGASAVAIDSDVVEPIAVAGGGAGQGYRGLGASPGASGFGGYGGSNNSFHPAGPLILSETNVIYGTPPTTSHTAGTAGSGPTWGPFDQTGDFGTGGDWDDGLVIPTGLPGVGGSGGITTGNAGTDGVGTIGGRGGDCGTTGATNASGGGGGGGGGWLGGGGGGGADNGKTGGGGGGGASWMGGGTLMPDAILTLDVGSENPLPAGFNSHTDGAKIWIYAPTFTVPVPFAGAWEVGSVARRFT